MLVSPNLVRYTFQIGQEQMHFDIGTSKADIVTPEDMAADGFPQWTRLDHKQCACCPLKTETYSHCPAAIRMHEVLETFKDFESVERVHLTVETERRTCVQDCDLQSGLNSMLGLLMATSGCPVVGKLRAITFHMPFCSFGETLFRSVSAYLTKQYFAKQDGWFLQDYAVALAKAGDTTQALATVSKMPDYGDTKASTYQSIIDSLLAQGSFDAARSVVSDISDPRWQATALASIGLAQARSGDLTRSRKTFAEARAINATVPESNVVSWLNVRSSIYSRIASEQSKGGDYADIKRWVPLLDNARDRASCWEGAAFWLAHDHYDSRKVADKNEKKRFYSHFSP